MEKFGRLKYYTYLYINKQTLEIMTKEEIKGRLSYLRREIQKEGISYGELIELQSLAQYIDKDDVLLLEWAGVGEGLN